MATIVTRSGKGSALSHTEMDANFTNLNNNKVEKTSPTGSAVLPSGTTAQRDGSPTAGYLRWNSTDTSSEVYDGTDWVAVGGGGSSLGTDSIVRTNAQTISENITIPADINGSTVGDVTIADGYTVTVNGRWVVI